MSDIDLSWGHININVADLDVAISFYEKLGFSEFMPGVPYLGLRKDQYSTLAPETALALGLPEGTEGKACILSLTNGFPKLDLTEFRSSGEQGLPKATPLKNQDLGMVRLCLATPNLSETYDALVEAGVTFLSPPASGHKDMADIAVCQDPDGTLIELIQLHLDKWS